MTQLNTKSLENALESLNRSIHISTPYINDDSADSDLQHTLQAGVIQHFEFCYELCWKMLKRQLENEYPVPSAVDAMSYPELIREGAERGLISDAAKWLAYRHQRNMTSHTYHQEKADSVYETALEFYPDAYALLLAIQARNT